MIAFNDILTDREYRAYGSQSAYICQCGAESEQGSFEDFIGLCVAKKITFSKETNRLEVAGELSLKYIAERMKPSIYKVALKQVKADK